MSNKAITTNDLKAVLDVVLPPQPSEYKKLLWTNPSPTSAFAAQTVSLDLSDYDEVEIEAIYYVSSPNRTISTARLPTNNQGALCCAQGDGGAIGTRKATVSSTGIVFSTAKQFYQATETDNNNCAIPLYIYGIKYERVLPPAEDALVWKLKGTASGNTAVDMPTEYNEILLWTQYATVYFSTIVPRAEVPANGYIYPRTAFYYTSASNAGAYFSVSSSKANLAMFVTDGGTNYTSSATFKLYYR